VFGGVRKNIFSKEQTQAERKKTTKNKTTTPHLPPVLTISTPPLDNTLTPDLYTGH
jgi:hypothetical protein